MMKNQELTLGCVQFPSRRRAESANVLEEGRENSGAKPLCMSPSFTSMISAPSFRYAQLRYKKASKEFTYNPVQNAQIDPAFDSGIGSDMLNTSSKCKNLRQRNICNSSSKPDRVQALLQLCKNLQGNEFFSPPLQQTFYKASTAKKWKMAAYKKARNKVLNDIRFAYSCVLIVWDIYDVRCDYFYSFLEKFDQTVSVHDRWIPHKPPRSGNRWGGVVVVYPSKDAVKLAAKDIPKRHWILKTLKLSKLVNCLLESEVKGLKEGLTKISVLASKAGSLLDLQLLLHQFGRVVFCDCSGAMEHDVASYEVIYANATHAFLALIVLDGLPFGSGYLSVRIVETEKERAILNNLPKILKCSNFPFKGM